MRIFWIILAGVVGVGCGYSGETGVCAGVEVGGYCWYLGEDSKNCVNTCSGHGGTTDGTIYFAGSEGSLENCTAVALALGKPAAVGQDTTGDDADYVYMGCMWAGAYDETLWLYGHLTNHTAKYGADHRFCSCVE